MKLHEMITALLNGVVIGIIIVFLLLGIHTCSEAAYAGGPDTPQQVIVVNDEDELAGWQKVGIALGGAASIATVVAAFRKKKS